MTRLQEVFSTIKVNQISKQPPKIISCRISRNKLIAQLDDGREISTPVALLTKWGVLDEDIQPEQLKNNIIKGQGRVIYFPDIDDALPSWKIIEGLHSC